MVTSRVLKPGVKPDGRLHVTLFSGGRRLFPVHHLVLLAFVGPCPAGHEACHRDDKPANNTVGNLRWDTHAKNYLDAVRNGRARRPATRRGTEAKHALLDVDKVRLARGLRGSGLSYAKIAKRLGVSRKTAEDAIKGKTWSHVR